MDDKKDRIISKWSHLPTALVVLVLGFSDMYQDAVRVFQTCRSWNLAPAQKEKLQQRMNSTIGYTIALDRKEGEALSCHQLYTYPILFPGWSSGIGHGPYYIGRGFASYSSGNLRDVNASLAEILHKDPNKASFWVKDAPSDAVRAGWSNKFKVPSCVRQTLVMQLEEKYQRLDEIVLVVMQNAGFAEPGAKTVIDISSFFDPITGKAKLEWPFVVS